MCWSASYAKENFGAGLIKKHRVFNSVLCHFGGALSLSPRVINLTLNR